MNLKAMAACAALILAACASEPEAPPVADAGTQRSVTGGEVVGFIDADTGAQVWQGLPFAAAPAGELRWRAPRPVEGWSGTREALAHPEMCPQITNALNAEATGAEPGQLVGSEDCLKLDVYAPAGAGPDNAERPVMVWIHGGANVWGSASQYDGAQLASDQDVVVVVVQYRLGPLGFFAHPALADDAALEFDAAANFALLDQIAALEWVQANAAQFGGDASNVTIFGESAGGHNVAGLMASPLAEGLFHRAIIQSGSFVSVPLEEAQSDGEFSAAAAADRFAGADAGAEAIRAAPLQAVYDAYAGEGLSNGLPRMIQDGVTIPLSPLAEAFSSPDTFNAVPVITGTNKDELKLFNILDPSLTNRWFGVIIRVEDQAFFDILSDYQSRLWRVMAVDEPAARMVEGGHGAVFAYRFDWDEGGSMAFMDMSKLLGAAHAMEIPFVFNHFDFFGRLDQALFNDRNSGGREAVAASMGAYWASFARTGDPASAGGPDWPAWREDGVLMRFDTPDSGGPEIITGTDSVARIGADLAADDRLTDDQRCLIRERLVFWRTEVDDLPQMGCAAPGE
jgi:para-nitrobenzyl esterase